MQWPIAPTTAHELMELPPLPLIKFEIQVPDGGPWIDICDYWGLGATAKKSYLLDFSFETGGARPTPEPIAGQFSAVIDNPGNIFHPFHPTSGAQGFFRAGRRVRISLGGHFASGDNDWQRIIGFMDEPQFSSDKLEVNISGLDYMRRLSDMKFNKEVSTFVATPIDNYWGALQSRPSLPTTTFGGELYAPPGGDAGALPADEAGNVANWVGGPVPAVIAAVVGTLSAWEIKFDVNANPRNSSHYNGVCNIVAGTTYQVTFRYARTVGTAGGGKHLRFTLYRTGTNTIVGGSGFLDPPTNGVYETSTFSFTPSVTEALDLHLVGRCYGNAMTWRIDEISIRSVALPTIIYYNMPDGCTGIYHVELDGVEQWPGKQKGEGWYYDLGTNRFWFDIDKIVAAGVGNNLLIYYYTTQQAQNVVADILVKAYPTVFANRVAALNAMQNPVTGVGIDRVWFKAGSAYVDAMRMLCERCNYRFYFAFDGTPRFVPAPTPAAAPIFIPFLPKHFQSPLIYQSQSEIWNRIVIEGDKIAELTGWEENMPSELRDEAFDNASMLTYGTRTLTIKNHLFQDLAAITAMCGILLALYKDSKWYLDFDMPYNAAPMEIGD
ncbi:MAG: hypothetical protein V3W19_17770, partial [Desulfatiglandales bacterium]